MTAAVTSLRDSARGVVLAYRRAMYPLKDLVETEYLNGVKAASCVGDAMRELVVVDERERELVLEIVAAGIPASVVARRCGYAPATVARWIAEETP